MKRVDIGCWVVIFLVSFLSLIQTSNSALGVEFISFVEGDPGIPGDGVFVSPSTGALGQVFNLDPTFPLAGVTDGITVTSFPSPGDLADFQADLVVIIHLGNNSCKGPVGVFANGQITFNGVTGFVANFSQPDLENIVSLINLIPGCDGLTLDDFSIVELEFEINIPIKILIPDLDAVAIGLGQNAIPVPENVFIDFFQNLLDDFKRLLPPFPSQSDIDAAVNAIQKAIDLGKVLPDLTENVQFQFIRKNIAIVVDLVRGALSGAAPGPPIPTILFGGDCEGLRPNTICFDTELRFFIITQTETQAFNEVKIRQSQLSEFVIFNFLIRAEVGNASLLNIGDKFPIDIPLLELEPSFAIVEVINTAESGLLELRVEGITANNPTQKTKVSNISTLSEWGLIAMAGVLGIVGFMVLRKRQATA